MASICLKNFTLFGVFAVFCIGTIVMAERTKPTIYTDLDSKNYCFRRLNQTHQLGCSSPESGSSGVVKVLREDHFMEDMSIITTHGSDAPYVVAFVDALFNMETLQTLKAVSQRVAGVIVLNRARPSAFSSDQSCPNQQFSLYVNNSKHQYCRSQEWNKPQPNHHEGLYFQDWPFPIFLLRNESQIELLLNKTGEHDQWPKLSAELVSPMNAAVNSVSCTRRSRLTESSAFSLNPVTFCDPIGGINIYHPMLGSSLKIKKPKTEFAPADSIVMLAARLDSFSMFDELSPGADSTISSLITIMAIADLLNNATIREEMTKSENRKHLILTLFDGEALDYIGSGYAAYMMLQGEFMANYGIKLNLTSLSHMIELNQVMHHGISDKLDIYLHKHLKSSKRLDDLIDLIESSSQDLADISVKRIPDERPLPPSSAQSFLKLRDDGNFSVIVVTNHEREYINKYYNSFYEDGSDRKPDLARYFASLATLFSRVVYKLVTGNELDHSYHANETLTEGLIKCFLQTSSCELFYYAQEPNVVNFTQDNDPPFPTYASVYGINNHKQLRFYTRILLHYLTGERMEANSSQECNKLAFKDNYYSYLWQIGFSQKGECVRSSVRMENTISPAFNLETFEVNEANLKDYPLWTESKWSACSLRIFVSASPLQQWGTFVLGILVLILSLLVVMLLNHNSTVLFKHCATETNGDTVGQAGPSDQQMSSNT